MGPVTWVLAGEMLPSRARAKGMTLCSFVNRLVSGTVALSALSTCDALGFGGFFALYGTLAALGTAWYALYVPETKGKTLEEITAAFKHSEDQAQRGAPTAGLTGSGYQANDGGEEAHEADEGGKAPPPRGIVGQILRAVAAPPPAPPFTRQSQANPLAKA